MRALALGLVLVLLAGPTLATCGGGGGGGLGGVGGGGMMGEPQVYRVGWKVVGPTTPVPAGPLVLYWFPTSPTEARASDLQDSRPLTLASARCVAMVLVTTDHADLRTKFAASADAASVVLADTAGTPVGRVAAEKGRLSRSSIEKLVLQTLDQREDAAKAQIDQAAAKEKQGDHDGAAAIYSQVWEERCLLPSPAKKAAKALKKMGRPVPDEQGELPDPADPSRRHGAAVTRALLAGLRAENELDIPAAQRHYEAAVRLDPADPVALRFLGELHRHHTGDWARSRQLFERLLAAPADPVSRAVALHGLGKITIHEGQFARGLELFEQSLREFPLALTYRNLAVYWNSERQYDKAAAYVEQARLLAPDDPYNQIFAAVFLAEAGKTEEAGIVAREHEQVLAASYNLAAIYAQLGMKDKALALLQRHFYAYERFDAVRRKEMQEARDDFAFVRYQQDPDFVHLTALADGGMTHGK